MITLQIKRAEFELIISGSKTIEYRAPSLFNKRKLLIKNKDGVFDKNSNVQIKMVNGYKKDAPFVILDVSEIVPIRFSNDFEDPKNNFRAKAGECTIEIKFSLNHQSNESKS